MLPGNMKVNMKNALTLTPCISVSYISCTSIESSFLRDSHELLFAQKWPLLVARATETKNACFFKNSNFKHEVLMVQPYFMHQLKDDNLSFHLMYWSLKSDYKQQSYTAFIKYMYVAKELYVHTHVVIDVLLLSFVTHMHVCSVHINTCYEWK